MRFLVPAAAAALAACAGGTPPAAEQAALADVPGKPIGEPVSCLQMRDIERVEAVNKYVAFVHARSNKVYRTDFPGGCSGLKRDDAFSIRTTIAQYCRGDIIQTFDPVSGFSSGACTFGSFTPYELPAKDKAEG
jgi:Family of unknown function (DUF6491)